MSALVKGQKDFFEVVIGLEVHAQIVSQAKLFSGAPEYTFDAPPNTCVSFLDAGFPGMLPVLNEECLRQGIKTGLGLSGTICLSSVFERKNYFYPDNPTGYQISQNKVPLVKDGHLVIYDDKGTPKTIRIERLHLEQDAGKSFHDKDPHHSYIDLNRAGVGLMEIVSHPDLSSPDEAVTYAKQLRALMRYLGTCDGNMEEGNLRVDANISVRLPGEPLGTRVELKNMNSFRYLHAALTYEISRHIACRERGEKITQETRLFDPKKGVTAVMREKEEAYDYRYFPDPDLPRCTICQSLVDSIAKTLPELPQAKQQRFREAFGLSLYDALLLTEEQNVAAYFEETAGLVDSACVKYVANWITGELFATLNKTHLSIEACPITPQHLAALVTAIHKGDLSNTLAKTVFGHMWETGKSPTDIMEEKGLRQVSGSDQLGVWITAVLEAQPETVAQYLAGKEKVFPFLVGLIMKEAKGKANPQEVHRLLREALERLTPS